MDRLEPWRNLLEKLESPNARVQHKDLDQLTIILQHLEPQVAARQQKEHDACVAKSHQVLGDLFDRVDLIDEVNVSALIRAVEALGYFRLAQITYANITPVVVKTKWYDLEPLLPPAGTIGWKAVMNFGIVKEEQILIKCCLRLLKQKLHYCSILLTLDQPDEIHQVVQNGAKVAHKLFELIKDVAYDDQATIGIDRFLFELLIPFMNEDQQTDIIKAIVQDLFKPFLSQRSLREEELKAMYQLIHINIMNHQTFQERFVHELLEHLRCNIIRRKRRHSVESLDESVTLESILAKIATGTKLNDLLPSLSEVDVNSKSLQTGYLEFWVVTVNSSLMQRALAPQCSAAIMNTCIVILVVASQLVASELIERLSNLISATIENTAQNRLGKLFDYCDPVLLSELTKVLAVKTEIPSSFELTTKQIFVTYLNRYLISCAVPYIKSSTAKFEKFVNFICGNELEKEIAQPLQCICIREISNFLGWTKSSNKVAEACVRCMGTCAKQLFKFIKRNLKVTVKNDEDLEKQTINAENQKQIFCAAIDAIVCIIGVSIERKDQEISDLYGDALVKIYDLVTTRIGKLVQIAKSGLRTNEKPECIDANLCKLVNLYLEHKDVIGAYLNYDVVREIIKMVLLDDHPIGLDESKEKPRIDCDKKILYKELKSKLQDLDEKSKQFATTHQLIIQNLHSSIVNQSISSTNDIKKEKSCCKGCFDQMRTLRKIAILIFKSCENETYKLSLKKIANQLEQLDALDHPRFIYLAMIFEGLIYRHNQATKDSSTLDCFKTIFPKFSCNLIRVSKSVELAPSVHSPEFTSTGAHRSNKAIQCCTYSICIRIYSQIFLKYPPKFTNQFMTDAMQICISSNLMQYAKYSTRLQRFFVQLASSIAGMLKSVCIGRQEADFLPSSMPIFLSVFSLLIRCLILASDRMKLENTTGPRQNGHQVNGFGDGAGTYADIEEVNKIFEDDLELLALDISKTLNNLSHLRVKLVDYAPHLITTYIKDIQRASCPDFVRTHLNEGIFRIFNLVDAHQKERQEEIIEAGIQRKTVAGRASGSLFEMIHARLDQASREIFKDMHDNYNRFHRYVGKV